MAGEYNRARIQEVLQYSATESKQNVLKAAANTGTTTSDKKKEAAESTSETTTSGTKSTGEEYETTEKPKNYSYSIATYDANVLEEAKSLMNFDGQNTNILGVPHQFLPTADMRIDSDPSKDGSDINDGVFGYCFAKDIFIEKPIVTLMPGTTNFLPDMSKADKESFASLLSDYQNDKTAAGVLDNIMASFDAGNVRYYDFKSDYSSYIRYVNLMCRVASVYMGLGDRKGPNGTKYKSYDWATYQQYNDYDIPHRLKDLQPFTLEANLQWITDQVNNLGTEMFLGYKQYVHFYVDTSTSASESISNTTQKSQLEGMFDTAEGFAKEATMILNSVSDGIDFVTGFLDKATDAIGTLANTITFGHFKDMLTVGGKEVIHGANLIYPEIWMDSEYSKDFSITVDLVSPYGDDESIYLNIIVPMIHLMAFALPRQSTANSFISPFLVRGYSKGWFSCDMGIVSSISFDKGPDQSWTVNGLPSRVKVTLNIKDLYSKLMMTPAHRPDLFFTNQGMIDYLGSMCGLDLTRPNIITKMETIKALLSEYKPTNLLSSARRSFTQGINNKIQNILS